MELIYGRFYTYKQILIGLRKEYLKYNEIMRNLKKFFETPDELNDKYYFFVSSEPELILGCRYLDLEKAKIENGKVQLFQRKRNSPYYNYDEYYVPEKYCYFVKKNCLYVSRSKKSPISIKAGLEHEFSAEVDKILSTDFLNNLFKVYQYANIFVTHLDMLVSSGYYDECMYFPNDLIVNNDILKFGYKEDNNLESFIKSIFNTIFDKNDFPPFLQKIIEENNPAEKELTILPFEFDRRYFNNFSIEENEKQLILRKIDYSHYNR